MSKGERFISYVIVAIIFLFLGTFWRMSQETEIKLESYHAGKVAMIEAIRNKIPKGYVFYIEGIKFIPRKDGAVNVPYRVRSFQVAGACDQHIEGRRQ
jgi:hypothetical protein